MKKIAFVFAGQGAQYSGMGQSLYETSPAVKALYDKAEKLRPGESGLVALDWWNGNRSVLVNADLTGLKGDVRFLECERYQIRDAVLTIVRNALDKGYDINDIQVLSPMYGGAAGIDILNNALQETFNPPAKDRREFRYGYLTFRTGDKILQLKNQPDDDVYNGDIGILEEILKPEETENHQTVLVVRFDDIYVEYNQENLGNITLAYCISVHKSQGSEYPIVIFPITFQHVIMLQRNLIYTGVTRARQSLVMIGEADAFRKGIETKERHHRQTGLKERLSIEEDILL